MRASADVAFAAPERLARQTARHFAHKVDVEERGARAIVHLPTGTLELEPDDDLLRLRAAAPAEPALARVLQVGSDHVRRFAHAPLAIVWTDGLEARAEDWIGEHPNAHHLFRTRDWLLRLRPGAGEDLRLAALTHDVERQVPGGPRLDPRVQSWDDAGYLREHSERSAALVADWLREHGAGSGLVERVSELVRLHEVGGTADADVLQAADSLSFLDVNVERARAWIAEGRATPEQARAKLDWMLERMTPADARARALPLHARAVGQI